LQTLQLGDGILCFLLVVSHGEILLEKRESGKNCFRLKLEDSQEMTLQCP
jgi:hypothetical protein